MKLHLTRAADLNLFTGHGPGYVAVNGVRHKGSLVVTPRKILDDWRGVDFERIKASHFEFLLTLKPEIVLLGTGATLRFPASSLSRCLIEAHVGLEVMDVIAACRTYNILSAESRNVVAALLLDP